MTFKDIEFEVAQEINKDNPVANGRENGLENFDPLIHEGVLAYARRDMKPGETVKYNFFYNTTDLIVKDI
jgi:hypothetical protein